MRIENTHSEVERPRRCPEYGEAATHLPDCPRYAKAALECVPPGYNYSHLVGDPVRQTDHRFDAAQFDGLLTDDDRTLLRLGMHIAW